MIIYKTEEEIELIKQSANILSKVHGEIAKHVVEGVTTLKLDAVAEEFIRDNGGSPSFKGYNGFKHSLCISLNSAVVHGIPGNYSLQSGDVVSIDCGVFFQGFHSDSAYTHAVGEVSPEVRDLLLHTKESLYKGIEWAVAGARIGDIGYAVQSHVEQFGYGVVRELVGHGLGRNLHESPEVPNYGKRGQGMKLQEGLVLAIEPMVNLGSRHVVQEEDGWTIRTRDKKPSAHFEHTVVVRKGKAEILTTFDYIDNALN
ncbi:type I methionyl aminopeptidase [Rufibacter quisquiliarum]|uniref:Methionine aminopeptidase n=1 Tax=Rufibacter quisquiliarum TaxID=1549639 RepID=A0A839GVM1_9BACT|nr:type I methionyl aminopeptidase [Rufibacter quisquiliarum]MBA9079525.1 methionyl aminopeptidase [Rufibacter quisquiliarum]